MRFRLGFFLFVCVLTIIFLIIGAMQAVVAFLRPVCQLWARYAELLFAEPKSR